MASQRGNAHRGAGTENREFKRWHKRRNKIQKRRPEASGTKNKPLSFRLDSGSQRDADRDWEQRPRLFLLCGLFRHRVGRDFGHLHKRELELAEDFDQKIVVSFREVSARFLAQSVEHVDHFARALEIEIGLTGAWVG